MITVLMIVGWALFVAIAWVLVLKYLRTRDKGFLWLAAAFIVWPLINSLLGHGNAIMLNRLADGEPVGWFPFTLVEAGRLTTGDLVAMFAYIREAIRSALILIGIASLHKTRATEPGASAPQTQAAG